MANILNYVYIVVAVLISLCFHEFAHGFVSYKLGDPTAKMAGRLTLNPAKHLDPLGTIMMIGAMASGFGFGWAKPVPINPMYYRNKKVGTIFVSLAGPLMNMLLSLISVFPLVYIYIFNDLNTLPANDYRTVLYTFIIRFFETNISLAIFNLIPLPPLDGSKILAAVLPDRYYYPFLRFGNYAGFIVLLIIFSLPQFSSFLGHVIQQVENAMVQIALPVMLLFVHR